MSSVSHPVLLLIVILFVGFVFLLLREVVMWYWKVNRIVELLESIDRKLPCAAAVTDSARDENSTAC